MKSLLVIAHGSRRQASNDEVRFLTGRIADKAGNKFDIVKSAFLELAEPSIPDGIQQCVEEGAEEIIVHRISYLQGVMWQKISPVK